ncbi:NodT family efflux transporter outer membrane factor (OMF) lipoprotein [Rhodanobacter sp. A1T4]|nr:NodT family efflux transporter outer membrane factor (OMF) lipoprotein [Rhodanobacter sp. A1T4]
MRGAPDLEVAEARYRSAERAIDVQRAQLNPQAKGYVDAAHGYSDAGLQGQVPSPGGSGTNQGIQLKPGSSYSNTGVAAALLTWDLDLWGKQKAAVAAAVGQANAARADRATAENSLQYNLVSTYFNWQATQARLAVAGESERSATTYRTLVEARVHAGLDDPQLLDTADSQLAQQRGNVAMLSGSSELDIAQMAAIAGVSPQEIGHLRALPLPAVSSQLPGGARLGLIARRPDIVSARWQIEAAAHGIDEARAAYYPDVSLMGLGGYLRAYPNLGSGTRTDLTLGSIGPSISLPIFSGGRLKAEFETSQVQLDTAVANYNRAVVQAAHDVAQQILTLQQLDAERVQQDRELLDSSSQLRRTGQRRKEGIEDDRTYLNAQMQRDQKIDAQLQLQGQQLATDLSLIHALGGGYRADYVPPVTAVAKDNSR